MYVEKFTVELKRCITIFPIFGTEGKSQVQQMMYSIRRSFEAMVRRYPRSSSILEDITNDQVIDILLDVTSEGSGASDQTGRTTRQRRQHKHASRAGIVCSGDGSDRNYGGNVDCCCNKFRTTEQHFVGGLSDQVSFNDLFLTATLF